MGTAYHVGQALWLSPVTHLRRDPLFLEIRWTAWEAQSLAITPVSVAAVYYATNLVSLLPGGKEHC